LASTIAASASASRFLTESADLEELEYAALDQEIEANLIHRNYMSQQDIDICLTYNLTVHANHPKYTLITTLHQTLFDKHAASE
jgi:hypothetical protein